MKGVKVIYNKLLHDEFLSMVEEDQKARRKLRLLLKTKPKDSAKIMSVKLLISNIDRKNTERLREIVKQYGWPGKALIGKDGADASWLLIQHAGGDRKFQRYCLELLRKAAEEGEASLQHVAYLTDRLLVAEGKKQIYGTQFTTERGKLVPFPIEDETNVDKRRKEVGLPPLSEYIKRLKKVYQSK